MDGQDIWTVIISNKPYGELSTVSFKNSDSAIEYVLEEMADALEFKYENEYDDVKAELKDQLYYEGHSAKYWIEETKLF